MNILHLLLTGNPGGIEILAQNIAQHSSKRHIMYFIFRGGAVADAMIANGIPVVIANTPRYVWKKSIEEFVRYCEQEKIDVVINHMDSPVACAFVYALKQRNPAIKFFSYLHCDVRDTVKDIKGKLLYKPFIKQMHKCCEKVFAISGFVKKAGMEAYDLPGEKIAIIYNGVDIQKFTPTEMTCARSSMELIFVGRLIREKGVHILLEALKQLPEDINVHTTIVGNGPEYNNLTDLANTLKLGDKVAFLGQRMDVAQLLANADYFVHPAILQEGFGITLIEAMASGKPCIASNGGAIPEIIDETNGFVFELGSASDLAQAITAAYQQHGTEQYRTMSQVARKRAESFNIDNMLRELESYLK